MLDLRGLLSVLIALHAKRELIPDKDSIIEAYEDVRSSNTDTNWAAVVYDNGGTGKTLDLGGTGVDYNALLGLFTDSARVYAYVRVSVDDSSSPYRFAFITWIGPGVPPLKKAKVSTDKAFLKEIFQQFGKEILADEKSEVKYEKVQETLKAASDSDYGIGRALHAKRELIPDKDSIIEAYEDVRSIDTDTNWAAVVYDNGGTGKTLELGGTGVDYNALLNLFTDSARVYGYVRVSVDDSSNSYRFAFITWIGPGVPPLKKARVSTDKAFVKEIFHQFGKEILADEKAEVKYQKVQETLKAASNSAYGIGRELYARRGNLRDWKSFMDAYNEMRDDNSDIN